MCDSGFSFNSYILKSLRGGIMKNKEKNFVSAEVYVNNNEDTIKSLLEKINTDKQIEEVSGNDST